MHPWFFFALPVTFAIPSEHIIGGSPVDDPDRHPWQGALLYHESYVCSCVLLTSQYALTAAHCTDGRNIVNFEMRFNSIYWESGGDLYIISELTQHPDFEDDSGGFNTHDVCILQSSEPISGSGVALDTTQSESDCWIAGWGYDESGSITDQLNEAEMTIMSDAECANIWGSDFRSDIHICIISPESDKGPCNHDSGGPLVANHGTSAELRGVRSWGTVGCYTNFPSVYARILNTGSGVNLKDWICDNAPGALGC